MSVQKGQPEVRFSKAGPWSKEGVSLVPKVLSFKKTAISGTSNNDFWVAPAGVLITRADVRIDVALDGSGTVELGTDGNPDALIDTTGLDTSTIGNWATNIGSASAAAANGLYLEAGDTIRLAIGGTPTVGAVSGIIQYFELDEIVDNVGVHFDLT